MFTKVDQKQFISNALQVLSSCEKRKSYGEKKKTNKHVSTVLLSLLPLLVDVTTLSEP